MANLSETNEAKLTLISMIVKKKTYWLKILPIFQSQRQVIKPADRK